MSPYAPGGSTAASAGAGSGPAAAAAASVRAAPGAPIVIAAPVAAAPDPYAMAMPPVPRGAFSRSWPVVVAAIAAVAIVVSVILLLSGGSKRRADDHVVAPPPAADHMNTDPLPPPSTDPWQGTTPNPGAGSSNTFPTAPGAGTGTGALGGSNDPFGGGGLGSGLGSSDPFGSGGLGAPTPPTPPTPPTGTSPTPRAPINAASAPPPEEFRSAQFAAICDRLAACGVLSGDASTLCSVASHAARDPDVHDQLARGDCSYDRDQAATCLNMLSSFPCGAGGGQLSLTDLTGAVAGVSACAEALPCH